MGFLNIFKKNKMVTDMVQAESQLSASELFEQGEIYQTLNPEKAFQYYLQSANKGYSKAMHKVGQCYLYKDKGATFDIQKSVYWYKKAAENDDPKAMAMLSWFYMAGMGVPQSDEIAKQWMQKAMAIGDEKTVTIVKRKLDNYEKEKKIIIALFEVAIEMNGIPRK